MKTMWTGFLTVLAATALMSAPAAAQNYPSRPITLVVPFPAGGSTDVVARIVAQELSKRVGVAVVTENRPGAAAIVGSLSVKTAKPDGYTLLLSTATFYSSALLQKNLGYDPFKDFVTLAPLAGAGYVLMTPASVKDLNALIERTKTKPGETNYAHLGPGGSQMLLGEMVKDALKSDWQGVSYKGIADAMVGMLRNDVQGFFATETFAAQHTGNAEVKLVGYTGTKRSPYLPDLPTFAELGYPDVQDFGYYVLNARADTPVPIVEALRKHMAEVCKTPELLQAFKSNLLAPFDGTIEEYDAWAMKRQERSAATLKRLGLMPQ